MRAQNAVFTLARVELEWHVVRIEPFAPCVTRAASGLSAISRCKTLGRVSSKQAGRYIGGSWRD
jgi:hypothetical protein